MRAPDAIPNGVPCWIETRRADPGTASAFYARIFGWDIEPAASASGAPAYRRCVVDGRDVAGIAQDAEGASGPASWLTYVGVEDVGEVAARGAEAGGTVVREPFASFDEGRMAILSDPTGATFGVWQRNRHPGAQLVNAPGAWVMSLLNTDDVDGAARFYDAALGWKAEPSASPAGPLVVLRLPDYVGGMPGQPLPRDMVAVAVPLAGDSTAHWSVSFLAHDVDAVAAAAQDGGGRVLSPPTDHPGYRETVVADLEGAVVAVSHALGSD